MPLCTVADVKHASRVDADITEHDEAIPGMIAEATAVIEQACNVPLGWFDAIGPAARGYAAAQGVCIALCARWVDERYMDPTPILRSGRLLPAYHGQMPSLPAATIPAGAVGLSGAGALALAGAGVLVIA